MNVSAILAWLHAQAAALFATVGDVAANRPEPAGQVVIRVAVAAVVIWAVLKIARKVSK